MTQHKSENPPAFPCGGANTGTQPYSGMTLRNYFAGQAIAGMVANDENYIYDSSARKRVYEAYFLVDAMLVERDK